MLITEQVSKFLERNRLSRRSTLDVMSDILRITTRPSTKTQILYSANLSYKQLQKYISMLQDFGMISELADKGASDKLVITERGKQFLTDLPTRFGRIAPGQHSIWT